MRVSFSKDRHLLSSFSHVRTDRTTMIVADIDISEVKMAARQAYKNSGNKGMGEFQSQGILWSYDIKLSRRGEKYLHINPTHSPPHAIDLSRGEAHTIKHYLDLRRKKNMSHDEAMKLLKKLAEKNVRDLSENVRQMIQRLK